MSKILHIGKYFPPFAGGIENFMADLMAAQTRLGDTSHALAHDHITPGWHLWPGFQADQTYPNVYRAPCYGRLLYAPISPHFPFWLSQAIEQLQPDLLHLHLPNTSAFWALLLPSARRLPWVIHWHSDVVADFDKRLGLAYALYRPFEQALLKRSRHIIATSPPYLEASPALKPWREKCEVVPLGIDITRLPEPTPEFLSKADALWGNTDCRLLSVGRLTYYKGYQVLLQAMANIENARLLVVGEGEQRPILERLIKDLHLTERVTLLGYCEDNLLTALMQSCDCFCLASLERTEAFGVVLMEAMRYGRPIVTCQVEGSGMGWVVEADKTGLLVPPNQVPALAGALQTIVDRPDLRKMMGDAGRERFDKTFAIEQIAHQTNTLYQQML
ncbi:MAG: glycosyltransferase [Pseudomonadota bacterium]